MSFEHQQYNEDFLDNISAGQPISETDRQYDLRIVEADATPGEIYWNIIGVHHLLPDENRGNHHIYLEALDESGQRIQNPCAWAGWSWEGRQADEPANPVPLDKPANEPAGNIAMFKGQNISVWINGRAADAADPSDRLENIHTNHPDEPLPDGTLWNTIGHHSFYVVFQRTQQA